MNRMRLLKQAIKKTIQLLKRPYSLCFHNKIGRGVEICKGSCLRNSVVGDYCYLGMYSYFNHVKMGNYCSIAGNVTIGAMEHDYSGISTSTFLSDSYYDNRITEIGDDVWIGAQCVIRQGVHIGTGAVIGANSFVNKDVSPYSVVVGSPARVLKYRFSATIIEKLQKSRYWEYPPKKARKVLAEIRNRYSM